MQALTLAQAAKALALSASSQPAARSSPAANNGALASQVHTLPAGAASYYIDLHEDYVLQAISILNLCYLLSCSQPLSMLLT